MSLTFFALAGLAASVSAKIYTTLPIASTICVGGQPCVVRWQDDNSAPLLAAYGNTLVDVWAGSDTQQVFVTNLGTVNPAQTNTLTATIPANVAPNGQYFIRYSSVNGRDATGNALLAFSTRFSLSGMTGTATPTVTQNPVLLTATPLLGAAAPVVANTTSAAVPAAVVAAANTNTGPVIVTATSTAPLPPAISSALAAASANTTKKSSADKDADRRAQSIVALVAAAAAALAMGF